MHVRDTWAASGSMVSRTFLLLLSCAPILVASDAAITNPKSGKCIDADESSDPGYPDDGTRLQLWSCTNVDGQKWKFSDGRIENTKSGKCIDADTDRYPDDGTRLQLWSCKDVDGQKWSLTGGHLVNQKSGKCIDAAAEEYPDDGTTLQLWKCNGDDHMKWSSPAPGPQPGSTWPQFASRDDLQKSPWGHYFTSLYGELPTSYPLRLSDFWCFYLDKMQAAAVAPPASVGQCPTSAGAPAGQRYDENNAYSSKDLTWLWQPLSSTPPYDGFPSHSIVEVSHKKDPFGDEHHGMWFLYGKGTGVFLDIGNTKIFDDHSDAEKYFGAHGNEDMCQKAAAKGYDSIQFIRHPDATNYPCAQGIGASWMNMEIVATRLVGTYPCGQAHGTAAALRAGWNGEKPCKCDPNNPNCNCVYSFSLERTGTGT